MDVSEWICQTDELPPLLSPCQLYPLPFQVPKQEKTLQGPILRIETTRAEPCKVRICSLPSRFSFNTDLARSHWPVNQYTFANKSRASIEHSDIDIYSQDLKHEAGECASNHLKLAFQLLSSLAIAPFCTLMTVDLGCQDRTSSFKSRCQILIL